LSFLGCIIVCKIIIIIIIISSIILIINIISMISTKKYPNEKLVNLTCIDDADVAVIVDTMMTVTNYSSQQPV
jgi:hypothetical protein